MLAISFAVCCCDFLAPQLESSRRTMIAITTGKGLGPCSILFKYFIPMPPAVLTLTQPRLLPYPLFSLPQPGPRRAGGFQPCTLQPVRYFAWINWSASGQFGHFIFAESHSSFIFLPRRNARLPSSTISLNGP